MDINFRISEICSKLEESFKLPEKSIFLLTNYSRVGKKAGQETITSICINEPNYPVSRVDNTELTKSTIVLTLPSNKKIELNIKKSQFDSIKMPNTASVKNVKDEIYTHVIFPCESDGLYQYITDNIIYCIDNYIPSYIFGCCGKFIACSDSGKCQHENMLYAKGCAYHEHLLHGEIFYGKNRNR